MNDQEKQIEKLKADLLKLAFVVNSQSKAIEERTAIVQKAYAEIIDRLKKLEA